MKLKIVGPAVGLLLLIGGVGVSAESTSNNGIPEQLTELQTTVSNLVNEVKDLLPLKDDVKAVKDQLATANTTISEQQTEIDSMKKEISDLQSSSSSSVETLTPEIKQCLIKEFEVIKPFLSYWDNASYKMVPYNITNEDVVGKNGKVYLQVFLEGNYDWGEKYYSVGTPGVGLGRQLAQNLIADTNSWAKLYGLNDIQLEIYQNGQKIDFSNYPPVPGN